MGRNKKNQPSGPGSESLSRLQAERFGLGDVQKSPREVLDSKDPLVRSS